MATDRVSYARKARLHLSKADPVLARIIAEVGALGIQPRRERFQALARAIIFQQLAGAAANAIYGRFVKLFPDVEFPSPEQVLAKTDAELRAVGLSEKKALYIKDLAEHIRDKKLDFHKFHRHLDRRGALGPEHPKGPFAAGRASAPRQPDGAGAASPAPYSLTIPSGVAALNAEATRQAAMVAYIDDFLLMMILVVIALPLILLLRRPRTPHGGAAVAALD